MLLQVLSQLTVYSTNTVNIGLLQRGGNGANLSITQVLKISKLVSCFFRCIENHILKGRYPDTVSAFTLREANLNHQEMSAIEPAHVRECASTAKKTKIDLTFLHTPAWDRHAKKQKLMPGVGSKDFTKASLSHCKEGTPISDLFPMDLIKVTAVSFASITRSVPSPTSLLNLITLAAGGTGFHPRTR
jgi:hypothetical protein